MNNNEKPKMSPPLLQRKFKLSYQMAKELCELAGHPATHAEWVQVTQENLPKHENLVLVYGRSIHNAIQSFEKCLAIFNANCGWVKHQEGILLFVTHYQEIPKDPLMEVNEENTDELKPFNYGPTK